MMPSNIDSLSSYRIENVSALLVLVLVLLFDLVGEEARATHVRLGGIVGQIWCVAEECWKGVHKLNKTYVHAAGEEKVRTLSVANVRRETYLRMKL
jgi:hypothetical protein